jgi:hypothetical protein
MSFILPTDIRSYGTETPSPKPLALKAGPICLLFDQGQLRNIRIGSCEVIRGISVAVRAADWTTIPAELFIHQLNRTSDSFEIVFDAEHRDHSAHFGWTGVIEGSADGSVRFAMEGVARRSFLKNRIGFCVLHPIELCAGRACTVERMDGTSEQSWFPTEIAARQPFLNFRSLRYGCPSGAEIEIQFEGDTFEMEDQRNWTDASFKSYGTPLELPHPVEISEGTRVKQSVSVRLATAAPRSPRFDSPASETSVVDLFFDQAMRPIPALGLNHSSPGLQHEAESARRLTSLGLSHLRVDLDFGMPDSFERFLSLAQDVRRVGCALEVAVFLSRRPGAEFRSLAASLRDLACPVSTWLIFSSEGNAPTSSDMLLGRQILTEASRGSCFATGTSMNFAELNRGTLPIRLLDRVTFAISPQVHANDSETLRQNLAMQSVTGCAATSISGGVPSMISSITLKPRPLRGVPPAEEGTGELPRDVDVRQASLFGAAWTVGSISNVFQSGVCSVTYYDTIGWRGIMDSIANPSDPRAFPAIRGGVYPLFHVLADVAEFGGGGYYRTRSERPGEIEVVAVRKDARTRLLLSNLTDSPKLVRLNGCDSLEAFEVRTLDRSTVEGAMEAPETFRRDHTRIRNRPNLETFVPPLAVLTLDGV